MRSFKIYLAASIFAYTPGSGALADSSTKSILRGSLDNAEAGEHARRPARKLRQRNSQNSTAALIADLRRRIEVLEKDDEDSGNDEDASQDIENKKDEPDDISSDDDDESQNEDLTFTPFFAGSAGFDTNPDEEEGGEGSVVQRYDAGMTIDYDKNGTEVEFEFIGTFLDTVELENRNRWQYTLRADGETKLLTESGFLYGFERTHDKLTDPETITNQSYIGVRLTGDNVELQLRGSIEDEVNLTGDDDFGDSDPEEFDFFKTTAQARLELNTKGRISPFVDARVANLNFPSQDIEFINRNADDYSVIGGAVFKPVKAVELSIGGRHNVRQLRDLTIPEVSNNYIDASLTIKPNDKFKLSASVDRKLTEPTTESSVVADTRTYAFGFEWTPTDRFEFNISAAREKNEEVGEGEFDTTDEVKGEAFYRFTDHLRFFTVVTKTWVDEEFIDDIPVDYERLDARAGIETSF